MFKITFKNSTPRLKSLLQRAVFIKYWSRDEKILSIEKEMVLKAIKRVRGWEMAVSNMYWP